MTKTEARCPLVKTDRRSGSLGQTLGLWQSSPQVVCPWVRRFQSAGKAGRQERSRRPPFRPRQIPPAVCPRVVEEDFMLSMSWFSWKW